MQREAFFFGLKTFRCLYLFKEKTKQAKCKFCFVFFVDIIQKLKDKNILRQIYMPCRYVYLC